MLYDVLVFIGALFLIVKGATLATKYSARLAESYKLSEYAVGFIVIAIISILPEAFISVNAAIKGIPSFGLGTLFGSNIADLTLVFAIITIASNRALKIEGKILKNHVVYPFILLIPLILGLNGHYSRFEGMALILSGGLFYWLALKNGTNAAAAVKSGSRWKSVAMLAFSMGVMLPGSYLTVASATALAGKLGISSILIGMLIVGLGTTMPELFFALKSVKRKDDSLAVGDILGTVLADATIVVGILALVSPFFFPKKIIYITGAFMVIASLLLFSFMRSGRKLTRREAVMLLGFWLLFVLTEFAANGVE